MRTAARLDPDQARRTVGKLFQYLGALDLRVDHLSRLHVYRVHLKNALGDVQTDHLLTIHHPDSLSRHLACVTIHPGSPLVFVKTKGLSRLGTLMPYPAGEPAAQASSPLLN